MAKLEELEMAIASLSEEEYREFRRRFLERDWERWDRRIEEDSKAGTLDFLVKEAREAKQGGSLVGYGSGEWAEQREMAEALEKAPTVTKRELDIIRLVSEGLRNKEIAEKLGISEKTVKAHMDSVFKKLTVEHRLQNDL